MSSGFGVPTLTNRDGGTTKDQYDSVIYISIYYWSTFINGMKGYTSSSITALHGSSCAENMYMYIYFQNDDSVSLTKKNKSKLVTCNNGYTSDCIGLSGRERI